MKSWKDVTRENKVSYSNTTEKSIIFNGNEMCGIKQKENETNKEFGIRLQKHADRQNSENFNKWEELR